eukprot:130000-Pleurochrysis_carterae.AAC.2
MVKVAFCGTCARGGGGGSGHVRGVAKARVRCGGCKASSLAARGASGICAAKCDVGVWGILIDTSC